MNPLLREWLDEKNLEFNHRGYSQETLTALKEFADYVAAQPSVQADECPTCAGFGFVSDKRGRLGVDCSDCNGSGIRR